MSADRMAILNAECSATGTGFGQLIRVTFAFVVQLFLARRFILTYCQYHYMQHPNTIPLRVSRSVQQYRACVVFKKFDGELWRTLADSDWLCRTAGLS